MKNKYIKSIMLFLTSLLVISVLAGCTNTSTTSTVSTSKTTVTAATTTTVTTTSTTVTTATATTTTTAKPATRVITDMFGSTLTVPSVINKVLSGGPVETQIIYMLAPDKLAAVNGTVVGLGGWNATASFWNTGWDGTPPYIPAKYLDQAAGGPIPDIGNGSSGTLNFEQINLVNPDIVIEGKTKNLDTYRSKIHAPVVGVNAGDSLCWDFEGEITFLGELLGVPEKARELNAYYKAAMDYVNKAVSGIRPAKITDKDNKEQVRVLYSQGNNGYQTDARGSWHTNLLWYCGGANVADVIVSNTSQAVTINGEQILSWNDNDTIDMVIIGRSSQAITYNTIMNDATYKTLDCVKKGAVYVRPDNPTSWFDGPPGYGQIIGMYWMVNLLYPERTKDLNVAEKTKEFYSKFLYYNLTDAQVTQILKQPGAK